MSEWAKIKSELRLRAQVEADWTAAKDALGGRAARELFESVIYEQGPPGLAQPRLMPPPAPLLAVAGGR